MWHPKNMAKRKKFKQNKEVIVYFEGENGFKRREKWKSKLLTHTIKMPFLYNIRITSPVMGDYIDLAATPVGEFQLQKMTKTTATYKLVNLYQAKENLK